MTCWCGGESAGNVCKDSVFHDATDSAPTGPVRRIYVSGPMSGIPESNYPAFNHAAGELEMAGYEVVNPAATAAARSYREILKEDLRELMTCDAVATLDGWWGSKGANLEVHTAGVLQMPIRSVDEWLQIALFENVDRVCADCGGDTATYGSILCSECREARS